MGVSYRQARRIWYRYQREGPKGLISKRKGRPGNNRIATDVKEMAMALINEKHSDYGPTLTTEKLYEKHSLSLSKETVRKIMI